MIRLFDIQNNKIIPSEHCYTIETLKNIMDEYPEEYNNVYSYVYYMTCPSSENNPFFDCPETDKESIIRKEVGGTFDSDDESIQTAIKFCNKLYETPTSRAYYGIKKFLDKMGESLANEELTFGRDGSSAALLRMAEKFDEVRQSFKGVYKDLQDEQKITTRGGVNRAYDQQ